MMKRVFTAITVAVLVLSMLIMVSCGSEFSGEVNNEKSMSIKANKAAPGNYFVTGSLVVEEDEEIETASDLESGSIELQFISTEGMDNIDEVPDLESAGPVCATIVSGSDTEHFSFGAGTYMVKAIVIGKATGSIEVTIKKVGE